jgi:hypothetical protein
MDGFRLLISSLALGVLATSARAQTIDIVIVSGSSWVLNSSSSTGRVNSLVHDGPGLPAPCSGTDSQFAEVEYEIKLAPAAGVINYAFLYAKYTGSNHASCSLAPVSTSGSGSGYADFVHSSAGDFDIDMWSHAVANDTYAHAAGQANAELTMTLHSTWAPTPPLVKPPYHLVLTNSASVTGPGSGAISDWTRTTVSKTNRDYFSVTAAVDGDADVSLPSALINNPGVLGVASAQPNSNSYIRLKN